MDNSKERQRCAYKHPLLLLGAAGILVATMR